MKTFNELGIHFVNTAGCVSCGDGKCNATVTKRKDDEKEYHVEIREMKFYLPNGSEDPRKVYHIDVLTLPDISAHIEKHIFLSEREAVKFICDSYDWFECF